MTCGKLPFLALVLTAFSSLAAQDAAFPKGAWDLEISGSYTTPIRFSDDRFTSMTVAGGYYIVDNLSLGGELQAYYADQPDSDALIGGLGLLLRYHFLSFDRFSVFLDGGGSVTYASRDVPEFGTNFNYTGKVGLGLSCELRDNLHLITGVRYFHLSNANLHGRDQNPSYDGIQFHLGLMWTL